MQKNVGVLAALSALLLAVPALPAQSTAPWLAGCWTIQEKDRVVEENWTGVQDGVMLGVARTITSGRLSEYEFVVLRTKGGRLEYVVRMGENPVVVFTSTTLTATEVIFENPAHDFPRRIGYRLSGPDVLDGWIDGGDANGRISYRYRRATCGKV
jgi:uncharacterized protein DUF6265